MADALLAGRIELDGRTNLTVEGDSRDIAGTDDLMMRFRRALGTPDAQRAGFSGTGRFAGRWTGTLKEPVFTGRFAARTSVTSASCGATPSGPAPRP